MTALGVARQLFTSPGGEAAHTRHLLAQAAGAHAHLLDLAAVAREEQLDGLREFLTSYLHGPAPADEKRFVLDDPQLVEALHTLAPVCHELTDWDDAVAPGCVQAPLAVRPTLGRGRLGNVVAAVRLRRQRDWCGQIELATDDYGRLHFPFCDGALTLIEKTPQGRDLFARRALVLVLDERVAYFRLPNDDTAPIVQMHRAVFDRVFVDNRELSGPVETWPSVQIGDAHLVHFERAARLLPTRVRFEPVSTERQPRHAELSGEIVRTLLAAIATSAPAIHGQLCQSIRTIQGFELPDVAHGQIASFSVPIAPGVIGFNVQFTADDQPRFSPYAFMWLGHELGHTLHYLIDDVAYCHGWRFLENPGELTPMIPRYGRPLRIRTLFQVPYVHLFEWWLLMQFHEHDYAGLPWRMFDDAQAMGDDLRAEIHEAFDAIDQHARLTPHGQAVIAHLRGLVGEAENHWRRLTGRGRREPVWRRARESA